EVEDVPGPRVVVQLRDLREAHAFPAQIPLDLGLGERLDLAGLLRGERRGAGEHEGHDDEATHGSISSGSPANGVSVRRKITSCRSGRRTEDGAPGSGAVPPHAGPDEAPALQGRKVASPTRPLTQTPAASVYAGRALSRALATAIIAARGCCAVVLTPPGDSSRHPLLSSTLRGRACTLQHPGCAG